MMEGFGIDIKYLVGLLGNGVDLSKIL